MFVCCKQRQFGIDFDASLFLDFSTCRPSEVFAGMNPARRNLRASSGPIAMVDDE
jgi:hypothetical protein